ncbi:MAG: pyrroline-5-carboxylate reductase [Moraxellaceae bacterium]|nr:pyrroline-5-carboxylate reductase [Moraxellaceae bacterium]
MTQQTSLKVGFIGGGNMAQAIISGLLASGIKPSDIMVSDPVDAIREMLGEQGIQTTTDNMQLLQFTDTADSTIVLAIKPQLFQQVLSPLQSKFNKQLVLSIAAGVSIDSIEKLLEHKNIVRAMPNTPALIQQGATGLYASDNVSDINKATAEAILSATGLVLWVDSEEKLHAVTAVSGSAPAYFFYVMESMINAGVELGLTKEQATQLTLQTAFGSASMAISSEDSPTVLRQKVTSPNGTTHEAIESFKANGLDKLIAKGMQACDNRSREMASTA